VSKTTSVQEINAIMKNTLEGELVEQIKYSLNNELSSDIVGTSQPAIYDSNATIVSKDGKTLSYTFGTITNMGTATK
jgi:glyceraldehyde 3-phosphate dehydrogenase